MTTTSHDSPFLTHRDEIKNWLLKMNIKYFSIDDNLIVNVNGSVDLSEKKLAFLPVQFGEVKGQFNISENRLQSLEGAPQIVTSDYYCSNNKLKSLKGVPSIIQGEFFCDNNQLTTLEFSPHTVKSHFNCSHNKIKSLKGGPKEVGGDYDCSQNKLTNLLDIPQVIHGNFYCYKNRLQSLAPLNTIEGYLNCADNLLISLDFDTFKDLSVGLNRYYDFIFISLKDEEIKELQPLDMSFNEQNKNVRLAFSEFKTFLEKKKFEFNINTVNNSPKQMKI